MTEVEGGQQGQGELNVQLHARNGLATEKYVITLTSSRLQYVVIE